jgi:O-antigen ligase
MAELFLDVFYMLYLASAYRQDERLCRFGAKVYYWMGIIGGIYAVATFPMSYFFQIDLGTYGESHRLRAFNNEAGSYGTYLITVCALTMVMYKKGWIGRKQMLWSMALLLVCMAGSQSKAAFFAIAVIGFLYLMWALRGWRRWALVGSMCIVFSALGAVLNIPAQIAVYERGSALYQQMSNLRAEDGNFIMGRISGAVIAPRMIAAHPLLGIGWGNYPLVRDDPQYRRGTAFMIADVDSPSLGPIDYIVELGFPLWIYMTWASIKPIYLLRLTRADPWILCLAAMQPISNWFGAHLNITYPWVALGLALGLGFRKKTEKRVEAAS